MEPIMTAKQELASVRRQLEELWHEYNYEAIMESVGPRAPGENLGKKKKEAIDRKAQIGRQIDALSARETELKALVAKLDAAVGPRPRYVR
jgi:hypothetical protein